jgi:hypothetical protein
MRTTCRRNRSRLLAGALALLATMSVFISSAGAQSAGGLSTIRAQKIANQTIGSFPVQENDHFGATFAVGDFNGDGRDDLATGVPDDDGPILYGSLFSDGFESHNTASWSATTP